MRIDRTNIEAWLLDRAEGRLTAEQERALDAFLQRNPDLRPDGDDLPVLRSAPNEPLDKRSLKRFLPPTGSIDARTIDDYLIARLEGDLSAEQLHALEQYLAAHPELARTAGLYAIARFRPAAVPFAQKAGLARTLPPQGLPSPATLDDFLVARLEGDLDLQQRAALDRLLQHDAGAAQAWERVSRARIAQPHVAYPHKQALKKKEVKVVPLWSRQAVRYAAAASVALLLGMAWWLLREGRPAAPQFALDRPHAVQGNPPLPTSPTERPDAAPDSPASSGTAHTNTHASPGTAAVQQGKTTGQDRGTAHGERPAPVHPGIERRPAERLDRVEPLVARIEQEHSAQPIHGTAPEVPVSKDAPDPVAPGAAKEAFTVGELLASTMRKEVLDDPRAPVRKLDGSDAVALVDKGLNAVGGQQAGLTLSKENGRRRFNLRLGRDLAITASTAR